MTSVEIEGWLVARIAGEIQVAPEDVDVRTPFAELGIGSLAATGVAGDLEELLGRSLPATLLFDHPTVERLARFLGGE